MIHTINSIFCHISNFCFQNIFILILFLIIGFLILKYFVQKLSNITILLYLLFIISILIGGIVLILLPSKEDVFSSNVIDNFYLGILELLLFIALIVSIVYDIININKKPAKTKKKQVAKKEDIVVEKEKPVVKEKPVEKKKTVKKKEVAKKTVKSNKQKKK